MLNAQVDYSSQEKQVVYKRIRNIIFPFLPYISIFCTIIPVSQVEVEFNDNNSDNDKVLEEPEENGDDTCGEIWASFAFYANLKKYFL